MSVWYCILFERCLNSHCQYAIVSFSVSDGVLFFIFILFFHVQQRLGVNVNTRNKVCVADLSYCFILLNEALLSGEPYMWKKLENRPFNDL